MTSRPLIWAAGLSVLAAACALLLVLLPAGSAFAAKSLSFSLVPVGQKSYFQFSTRAGGSVSGVVRVVSTASTQRRILLRPADVGTGATGGLSYGSVRPRGVGTWLQMSRSQVVVPPHGQADVPFTARIPANPGTGQRYAGIVGVDASDYRHAREAPTPRRGRPLALRFLPRFAIAVEFDLPGRPVSRVELRGLDIRVTPSGALLDIHLANTGNQLIRTGSGSVSVSQGSETLFTDSVDLSQFVPGTDINFTVPWVGRPARDTYGVSGSMRPEGAPLVKLDGEVTFGDTKAKQFKKETGKEAKPGGGTSWLLIVLLILLLAVAVTFAVAYRRAKPGWDRLEEERAALEEERRRFERERAERAAAAQAEKDRPGT